jgi:hypothetical protein
MSAARENSGEADCDPSEAECEHNNHAILGFISVDPDEWEWVSVQAVSAWTLRSCVGSCPRRQSRISSQVRRLARHQMPYSDAMRARIVWQS